MPRLSPERPAPAGTSGSKSVLDLELEDEKENDRHRRRTQQSRDDPGAKACEAMCILCVGLLFLQVAWIVYTHGVDGTVKLLMAPEQPLRHGAVTTHSYKVAGAPEGYSDAVSVTYDAAGVQTVTFTVAGAWVATAPQHAVPRACTARGLCVGWPLVSAPSVRL